VTTSRHPSDAVFVTALCKSYNEVSVLNGIDLTVEAGTVFALLGPNGAGKTTIVQILSTLVPADSGTVVVAGHDVATDPGGVRSAIGVTGQFSAVDDLLTGRENLRLMADLYHLGKADGGRRVAELIGQFDLVDAADRTASTYSGGMRRKLDLAMTLVGRPDVIFLDEPTTGLDPRSRRVVWEIIRTLVSDGVTIFLTTQYLDEADRLASQVAVLDEGRIVAQGTPAQLKRLAPGGHVRLQFGDADQLDEAARTLPASTADRDTMCLQIPSNGSLQSLRELLDHLTEESIAPDELSVRLPDLDDVFLALTGHQQPAGS
jgi:ABC-2 type transport system ATP-binding protein